MSPSRLPRAVRSAEAGSRAIVIRVDRLAGGDGGIVYVMRGGVTLESWHASDRRQLRVALDAAAAYRRRIL